MRNSIYLLIDPQDNRPRYVGITSYSVLRRICGHRNEKRLRPSDKWLISLKSLGLKPIVKILAVVEDHMRFEEERKFIAYYRNLYPDLLNVTEGGEGSNGYKMLPNQIEKLRMAKMRIPPERRSELASQAAKARTGYHHSPETIEKIRIANRQPKGHKYGPGWHEKMRIRANRPENIERARAMGLSRRGIRRPPEEVEAIRKAHLGKKRSLEARQKMSESRKGRRPSEATKAKMSISQRKRWQCQTASATKV